MARQTAAVALLLGVMLSSGALGQGMSTPVCEQALILANGINMNIADQKQEQASVVKLQAILGKNPVDAKAFDSARSDLLTFVNNGIQIRQMNQAITPTGNKATAGLAKVANAQLEELGLAMSLSGDPGKDNKVLQTLAGDFAGGIMVNMQNLMDAMAGCGPAPAPAAQAGMGSAPAPAAQAGMPPPPSGNKTTEMGMGSNVTTTE
ncbi:uncharacterized protein PG986_005978 [Apiospora aurea]|uniref:Uncharacterized protein n=1 Tax=Apiospora aurea TaxID=335848 RepID=A0ABR1QKH2_9PEZI